MALELELDWKEFDTFFLIVKLENGQLPQGYYVSNGKPCRFHLQKVIVNRSYSVNSSAMKQISVNRKNTRTKTPNVEMLKQRVLAYKTVVLSCITQIVTDSETMNIFKIK